MLPETTCALCDSKDRGAGGVAPAAPAAQSSKEAGRPSVGARAAHPACDSGARAIRLGSRSRALRPQSGAARKGAPGPRERPGVRANA